MAEFKVKLFNDCKEKWQSHEATFYMEGSPINGIDVIGYGASKEEALNDMVQQLEQLSQDLLVAIKQIEDNIYTGDIYVQ